jgi:large subunit ribosomal protein L10
MAVSREKKAETLNKLKAAFKESSSIVFVHFKGLKVKDVSEMRRAFRKADVGYTVAKKTLTKKALADAGIAGDAPELSGELAIAYSKDLLAPAREVYDFQKKLKDIVTITGGVFEGKYMTRAAMTEIAMIPPRQTLLGMFVNVINSPIQGLAVALDAVAKKKQ